MGFPDINTIEPLSAALDRSILELMKSKKITEEDKNQERIAHSMAAAVMIIVAAISVISLYFYVKNYGNKQSRKIYGSFMLLGTLVTGILFHACGMDMGKMLWLVYACLRFRYY